MLNNFIYADLSTYSPQDTITFYESVFEWQYHQEGEYYMAYRADQAIVGMYETPDQFKKIGMPHFWMSYVKVDDIKETVSNARALGGIIELVDEDNPVGKVALIRDPQGAGFTIYQGSSLVSTRTHCDADTLVWNELHVSDAQNVIPFYKGIFDWTFLKKDKGTFSILNNKKEHIADVLELSNDQKGTYEYWVCTFAVSDLKATSQRMIDAGGSLIIDEGDRLLMADNSGEAFFYIRTV